MLRPTFKSPVDEQSPRKLYWIPSPVDNEQYVTIYHL